MTTPALVKSADLKRMEDEYDADKTGMIYFVTNPEASTVKVGFSSNFRRRKEVLQTGNHIELIWYSGFSSVPFAERLIHRFFKRDRILNEWFHHTIELEQLISCFEDKSEELDGCALEPSDVALVFEDWANSYGRGRSANVLECANG